MFLLTFFEHLQHKWCKHVYTIYVVDAQKRLKGTLSLKRFLYASDETLIKDIFQKDPISVGVDEEAETVASKMEKYDLVVIPVVDVNGKLLVIYH